MNIQKLSTLAVALLINCAAIAAFLGWSANASTSAAADAARSGRIITLAPVNVYPSAAELQALHRWAVRND